MTVELRRGVSLAERRLVDVLLVQAPTVLAALESTRETWERYPLRVLDAPKGGGKTYALARVTGTRAVCVTDRKALAAQIAAGFGGEFRRDPGSTRQAIRGQAEQAPRFSCTLHTTPRLAGRDMRADTLIVDEAIHVLGTLATGAELRGRRRGEVYRAFASAIQRCRDAWFAQAGWDPGELAALVRTVEAAGRGERVLMVVVETPERRGTATEVPNVEALRDAALAAAVVGPVVYASTSRKAGERVQQEAIRRGLAPLVVSARTLHLPRVQAWLARPTAAEPFVILSPTVVSGLSIDTRPDGSPAYPHVFMEFCTWPGGLSLDDGLQMVARVRGKPTLTWWASSSPLGGQSADEHYEVEGAAAAASARMVGQDAGVGTGLDELAAFRSAANEASLAPSPRDAFIRGLTGDGWTVAECEPGNASPEDSARWDEARSLATQAYIGELGAAERGPVDQQTVATRLAELGLPVTSEALTGEALSGVEWLERHHPGRAPLDLLAALQAPGAARATDATALAEFMCRRDLPHALLRVELTRAVLHAANVDFGRLVQGGVIEVRATDLAGFTSAAWRYRQELARLHDIQAPTGKGGAVRALATLLGRIGANRAGTRRPAGATRARVYAFKLSEIALEAMNRRLGKVPVPADPAWTVFERTEDDVLRARVPVRLKAEAGARLDELQRRLNESSDEGEKARVSGAIAMIEKAATQHWLVAARRFRRGDAGRIQLLDSPLQSTPRSLRDVIVPELPGDVFVSGDFRSCHVAIAAARTGDAALHALLDAEDAYTRLAARFIPGVEDGRGRMKKAILAMLNGAGRREVGRIVGRDGRRIHAALSGELPGLARIVAEAKQLQAAPDAAAQVPTLTGEPRTIKKDVRSGGWRRLMSAMWTGPESEALGYVLAALPLGARLVAPMHDGLLVCCPRADAERVAAELRAGMLAGARRAGFSAGVKIGVGETWAESETTAR